MSRTMRKSTFVVPRSIPGRFVFACLCLMLMPIAALVIYVSLTEMPVPQQLPFWGKVSFVLFSVLIELTFLGLFLFAFFGLIWSVSGAEWAARLLHTGFRKMSFGAIGLLAFFMGMAAIMALFN
jgi:hypothetical protein